METFGPYFDPSVIGFQGRLTRLHKGAQGPTKEETRKEQKRQEAIRKSEAKAMTKAQSQMMAAQEHAAGQAAQQAQTQIWMQQVQAAQNQKNFERQLAMQKKSMDSIKTPEIPVAPPPPSESASDVEDSRQESRRNSARRKGLLGTTYAGQTGGYGSSTPMGGNRSLLG